MIKLFRNYFGVGFALANRNLEFAFITILFSLFSFIPSLFVGSLLELFLNLINVIVLFFSFGFFFSVPLFLIEKQKNKLTNWNYIFDTTVNNTKRLIIPGILIIVSIFVVSFIALFFLAIAFRGTSVQITQFLDEVDKYFFGWNIIAFLAVVLGAFLSYTSLFFALETKSLFRSLKESIIYGIRNLPFTLILGGINVLIYSIYVLFPISSRTNVALQSIYSAIHAYIGLVLISSILLYYQKNKR